MANKRISKNEAARKMNAADQRIKNISSIASNTIKKSNIAEIRKQYGTAEGNRQAVTSVDKALNSLSKTTAALARGVQQITVETARGVKSITTSGAKAMNEYAKAITEDIHINRQNFMVTTIGKFTPLVGYAVAKMMETTVFRNLIDKMKVSLGNALNSVTSRFKKLALAGWEKGKEFWNSMIDRVSGSRGAMKIKMAKARAVKKDKTEKRYHTQESAIKAAISDAKIATDIRNKAKKKNIENQVPHMAKGGYVQKEGMAKVHAAEVVQPVDKVVEQIVDQVNKRLDAKERKEKKGGLFEGSMFEKAKDQDFFGFHKMGDSITNAFQIMQRKQLGLETRVMKRDKKNQTGLVKSFFNAYSQEAKQEELPLMERQVRATLELKNTISGETKIRQAAWEKMLYEHPFFHSVLLLGKGLAKVHLAPFKFLFRKRGSTYANQLATSGTVFERLVDASSQTFMGSMGKFDDLITNTYVTANATQAIANKIGAKDSSGADTVKAPTQNTWKMAGAIYKAMVKKPAAGLKWLAQKGIDKFGGKRSQKTLDFMSASMGDHATAAKDYTKRKFKGAGSNIKENLKTMGSNIKRKFSEGYDEGFSSMGKDRTGKKTTAGKISQLVTTSKKNLLANVKGNTIARSTSKLLKGTGKFLKFILMGAWSMLTKFPSMLKMGLMLAVPSILKLLGKSKIGATLLAKTGIKGAAGVAGASAAKKPGLIGKAFGSMKNKFAGSSIGKLFGKATGKVAGKTALKSIVKKIPIIGLLAGIGFAASRLAKGDFLGAAGEVASGAAAMVPGGGTAASIAIDAGLAARDIKNSNKPDKKYKNISDTQGDKIKAIQSQIDGYIPLLASFTGSTSVMMLAGLLNKYSIDNPDKLVNAADKIVGIGRENWIKANGDAKIYDAAVAIKGAKSTIKSLWNEKEGIYYSSLESAKASAKRLKESSAGKNAIRIMDESKKKAIDLKNKAENKLSDITSGGYDSAKLTAGTMVSNLQIGAEKANQKYNITKKAKGYFGSFKQQAYDLKAGAPMILATMGDNIVTAFMKLGDFFSEAYGDPKQFYLDTKVKLWGGITKVKEYTISTYAKLHDMYNLMKWRVGEEIALHRSRGTLPYEIPPEATAAVKISAGAGIGFKFPGSSDRTTSMQITGHGGEVGFISPQDAQERLGIMSGINGKQVAKIGARRDLFKAALQNLLIDGMSDVNKAVVSGTKNNAQMLHTVFNQSSNIQSSNSNNMSGGSENQGGPVDDAVLDMLRGTLT